MRLSLPAAALLLFVLKPQLSEAQKSEGLLKTTKSTAIGAMASVPVGNFASTDLQNGGFARTGWGLYFDSKSTLDNGLSFISHSTYSFVPLNQQAIAETFTKQLGRKTTVTGGRHMPFLTTIGLGYDIRVASPVTFGITAQGGLLYNSFKSFELTVFDTDNTSILLKEDLKYDSQFTFAYLFGASVQVQLVKDLLDFRISGDYSASRFTSSLRGHDLEPIKTTQQIQIVNIGAGFVVHTR